VQQSNKYSASCAESFCPLCPRSPAVKSAVLALLLATAPVSTGADNAYYNALTTGVPPESYIRMTGRCVPKAPLDCVRLTLTQLPHYASRSGSTLISKLMYRIMNIIDGV
jgi:hypothetical protein